VPPILLTIDRRRMGEFVNRSALALLAWAIAALIIALNLWLLFGSLLGWLAR
jgi:manganese transport protein